MALVAYDYSDSSDIEDGENDTIGSTNLAEKSNNEIKESRNEVKPLESGLSSNNSHSLFNLLPQPSKIKQSVVEEDDEFLHKKDIVESIVKPKAKITVPLLSDFKDVEGTMANTKPKVAVGKKSGLLSILPEPRNAVLMSTSTKSFVPHVLTQKQTTTVKKKEPLLSPAKIKSEVNSLAISYLDDSDNEADDIQNDFFSINKTIEIPVMEVPLDIEKKSIPITTNASSSSKSREDILQSYFKQETVGNRLHTNLYDTGEYSGQHGDSQSFTSNCENSCSVVESSNTNEVALDEEAIMKLCGSRGKRKREEIQIVDVNQQEVLADARNWLLKGLMDDTTKRVSSSKRRGDEPTSQQKRKHQITYLAHRAKANEAELQNQWANNRMSKRQTQSKYGF